MAMFPLAPIDHGNGNRARQRTQIGKKRNSKRLEKELETENADDAGQQNADDKSAQNPRDSGNHDSHPLFPPSGHDIKAVQAMHEKHPIPLKPIDSFGGAFLSTAPNAV
jgi:hypothetical protein